MMDTQDQAQQQPQFYPSPQPVFGGHTSEGALHYQIDPEAIIEDIKHILKCEDPVLDEKSQQYVWKLPEGMTPILNEYGINKVMAILKTRLTKIFILSDFDEDSIYNITAGVGINIRDDIYYNWDRYGISDPASASLILETCTDAVYATLRKAKNGNYLRFLQTAQRIQDIQQYSSSKPQQDTNSSGSSVLDWIMRKRK